MLIFPLNPGRLIRVARLFMIWMHFAAVEERETTPSLKGKPVVIGQDLVRRSLTTWQHEARKYGSFRPPVPALDACSGVFICYKQRSGQSRFVRFLSAAYGMISETFIRSMMTGREIKSQRAISCQKSLMEKAHLTTTRCAISFGQDDSDDQKPVLTFLPAVENFLRPDGHCQDFTGRKPWRGDDCHWRGHAIGDDTIDRFGRFG